MRRENMSTFKPHSSPVVSALTCSSRGRPQIKCNNSCSLGFPVGECSEGCHWQCVMCSSNLSSNVCSDFKTKYFSKLCSFPGSRICMLWPVLGLFHRYCHMLSDTIRSCFPTAGRELSIAVLSPPSLSLLFPWDNQVSFFSLLLGVVVPYQKILLVPLQQTQQSSVIYLCQKIVPINNGQMLRAMSLTVWAKDLHSSLIDGNILGLGNLDFSSRLWGKSTCCYLPLGAGPPNCLLPISFLQGVRE